MGQRGFQGERIITCCYCGARSTLPRLRERQALVCHGCGAPIRRIETLEPPNRPVREHYRRKPAVPHPAERRGAHLEKDRPARRRKGKRRKGLLDRIGDVFDDFDDILDFFD